MEPSAAGPKCWHTLAAAGPMCQPEVLLAPSADKYCWPHMPGPNPKSCWRLWCCSWPHAMWCYIFNWPRSTPWFASAVVLPGLSRCKPRHQVLLAPSAEVLLAHALANAVRCCLLAPHAWPQSQVLLVPCGAAAGWPHAMCFYMFLTGPGLHLGLPACMLASQGANQRHWTYRQPRGSMLTGTYVHQR